MRVLLLTGKGGVGKTSVAAATAVRLAAGGRRTLVVSTDPAHSLADALQIDVGAEPTQVAPALAAQQVDARARLTAHWSEIRDYLVALLRWSGMGTVEAEELSLLPGMEELFSLLEVSRHASAERHDALVVDCAPTAETLRLLSLPEVLRWYLDRVLPVQHHLTRAARPVLDVLGGHLAALPLPHQEVLAAVGRLHEALDGVRDVLLGDATTVRLVVNPERMVVEEARRTLTYLSLFGYRVDAVVVNRLLPESLTDPWFDSWKRVQAEHLRSVHDGFGGLPVLTATLAPTEVGGVAALGALAEDVYADVDPAAVLHDARPLDVVDDGDDLVLRMSLPFVGRDDVEVGVRGDELVVQVAGRCRAVVLPAALRHREVTAARVAAGRLAVWFAPVATAS